VIKFLFTLIVASALFWGYWNFWAVSDRTLPNQNISSGIVSYGKETMDSLEGNGFISLDGTQVRGKVSVNGNLKAQNATIGFLVCNGHANLQDCVIFGTSEVKGFMNAAKTEFQAGIIAGTQKIYLTDCATESLTIKDVSWAIGPQSVELKGNTVVKGSIIFESNKGVVYLSDQSRILGKVIGGNVEKLSW